ncbi:hypothetical protein [Sporosarcina sp. P35]|uniref:hypothetical protein n=1 Tax=Sporosarcina sp. P35 TaxID=2048246 RepID=UPI001E30AE71|nr:hypothetical protein [Sporosarcina sp. P35]
MRDEVDERLVPLHVIDHLADPILADSASYTDEKGNFYLVIIIETGLPEPYEVWLVNDEIVPDFTVGVEECSRHYFSETSDISK